MSDLAVLVPRPSSDVDVYGVCQKIESWAADSDDVGAIKDAKARLSAIDQYVAQTSSEGRKQISATMRRLEVRIGEVLGVTTPGTRSDLEPSLAGEGSLTANERHQFREMAAHADVVEKVIEESTDDKPASRNKVLAAIKDHDEPDPTPTGPGSPAAARRPSLPDTAGKAGWNLRKSMERVERVVNDDRFAANRDQVAAFLRSHLEYTTETCQGLLNQLVA